MITRRQSKILENQLIDPISLEPFNKNIFIHNGLKFDAHHLQQYLILNPNAVNPVTRRQFAEHDVKYLNYICANGKKALFGEEAEKQQKYNIEKDDFLALVVNELKYIVDNFLYTMDVLHMEREMSRNKTNTIQQYGQAAWEQVFDEMFHYIDSVDEQYEYDRLEAALHLPMYTEGDYFLHFPDIHF